MAKRLSALILAAAFIAAPVWAVEITTSPSTIRQLTSDEKITADELNNKLKAKEKIIVFDVRGKKSYDAAHISGAKLPLGPEFYNQMELYKMGMIPAQPDHIAALKTSLDGIPKDQPLITYCSRNCKASTYALFDIKKLGFTNVRAMEEGIEVWQEKGYPVEASSA